MSNEGEGAHEEEEDGGAILGVAVELPGNAHKSKEAGCFKEADQSGGLIKANKYIEKIPLTSVILQTHTHINGSTQSSGQHELS